MKKKFKQVQILISLVLSILFLYACGSSGNAGNNFAEEKIDYSLSASELAKEFYTKYFDVYGKDGSDVELMSIKEKYMTDILIEELELRSWDMESDAVTGVQDATGFINYMEVEPGDDEFSTKVSFDVPVKDGDIVSNKYKFSIHFKKVDDKKLMDTFDYEWVEVYANGDESIVERFKTEYANKDELTEEDKEKMANKRKYYEDLFSEGYIG